MPSLFSEQRNSLDVRWDFLFMVNQYHIEIWAWIPDYEGMYQASTLGEIRSFYNKRYGLKDTPQTILRAGLSSSGYLNVILRNIHTNTKRTRPVHLLSAATFMNHISDGTHSKVVDHKDNIKTNNHISNFQIITQRENASKNPKKGKETSKHTGVFWNNEKGKYTSRLWANGKSFHIGHFSGEKEASEAYQKALSFHNDGGDVFTMRAKPAKISQYIGVTKNKKAKRWIAKRRIKNIDYYIGSFDTELEAHNAYLNFKPKTQND